MWNANCEIFLKRIAVCRFFQAGECLLQSESLRMMEWEARDALLDKASAHHWEALDTLEALKARNHQYVRRILGC